MYLYLSGGAVIRSDEVIGVFNADNASHSKITREFLERRQALGELISVADDVPRYITVTQGGKTYLSPHAGRAAY
ncbi:MAG: DUF370 domain-containing protein [Oscillospiraceae bacterium]|jgi:hypothetical protein|nr:DUF370 domain-containing protein [Oscillospiraceae bacterium]